MKLLNIFFMSAVGLAGCVSNSVKYTNNEAEILKVHNELEYGHGRMPAAANVVGDVAAADKKISQTADGLAFAASTLAGLQGTWASKCTKAYTQATALWFTETLKFEGSYYTKSIIKFSDSRCQKSLKQVINTKVKIETPVSTDYGFRLTNNWTEAKQIVSSPSISSKGCGQETAFPGCTEGPNESPKRAVWLIATLSGTDELFTDKHSPEFTQCDKPQLVNGDKWCLLLKKTGASSH